MAEFWPSPTVLADRTGQVRASTALRTQEGNCSQADETLLDRDERGVSLDRSPVACLIGTVVVRTVPDIGGDFSAGLSAPRRSPKSRAVR